MSDCQETEYFEAWDCAITRAFRRAGKTWQHAGTCVYENPSNRARAIIEWDKSNLPALHLLTCDMYFHRLDPEPIPSVEFVLQWH